MSFTSPLWLWCMPVLALLLVTGWRLTDRRQRAALQRFVAPPLARQLTQSVSRFRRLLQRGFLLLAMLSLCAALAGPLVGYQWQSVTRRGNQIMFALDTSRSMLTPDLKPNRLLRAKLAIDDLARQLDGNAMGIVAFAGTAFLACPVTFDVSAFRESLSAIDTHTVPRGGTDVASAIRAAQDALSRRPGDKILILVTDGEDLEGHALDAARAAAQQGIKIFTLGVGSGAGELIPVPASEGGGFVKDEQGEFVRSRLDEDALKQIAAATGGLYIALGTGNQVDAALKVALDALAKQDLASRQQRVYTPRFQWPLCIALFFLTLSLLINTRRRSHARALAATSSAAGMLVLALGPLQPLRAADTTPAPTADEPIRAYNAGTAAYKAGKYPQAGEAFERSIRESPAATAQRLADQQDAYYNLGNAWYRAGQGTEKSSKEETLKAWNAAVKAYETALQMRPDDADSRFNRDFVKKKIDALNRPDPPQGGGGGGGGGQGKPPPGSPQPPSQPPPNQPPPGQPPTGQPPTGQPPPAGNPPPPPKKDPGQDAPPPSGTPPPAATPPPAQDAAASKQAADAAAAAPREPGQMSREEAQQLLDSAKSDEKHSLSGPDFSDDYHPPGDKPYKDW